MFDEAVLFDVRDSIARITLNRPDRSNSFDLDAAREFCAVIERTAASQARAVLLTGNGPRFCAGGDVASMVVADDRAAYLRELARTLEAGLRAMSELPIPVIAAVQGAVAGAGLAVVLNADVVVASRSTKFLTAYAGIGLTPDCGVSYLLPRAVGQQRALELALTGRVLSADEALEWGLIAQVVEADDLATVADELVVRVASGAVAALGDAKRLIRSSFEMPRAQSAAAEVDSIAHAVTRDEAISLIEAFTKRG
jgi:2-(1,2-epoxy-1,2-dihydrophenyl)acetyl-CoA isomerase